jgi:hypothetical protein
MARVSAQWTGDNRAHGGADTDSASAIFAYLLEVSEEGQNELGIDVGETDPRWWFTRGLFRERQQQPKGVPVSGDGAGAQSPLVHEILGEKALHQLREGRGEGDVPANLSRVVGPVDAFA